MIDTSWLRSTAVRRSVLPWFVPPAVALAITVRPGIAGLASGAILGFALLATAVRWPGRALAFMVVAVCVQLVGFSLLYRYGVPGGVLRLGAAYKETIVIGALLAGMMLLRAEGRRLDPLDVVCLLMLVVPTIYLCFPTLAHKFAPNDLEIRLLAWRQTAALPLVFLAARRIRPEPDTWRWLVRGTTALGVAAAVVAWYEWTDPAGWYEWVTSTAQVPVFQAEVLQTGAGAIARGLELLSQDPPRVGSIFLSAFALPDFLLFPVAIGLVRAVRGIRTTQSLALVGLCAVAIYVSGTRANAIAATAMLAVALVPRVGQLSSARIRMGALALLLAAVVIPGVQETRFGGAATASESNRNHIREWQSGFDRVIDQPTGFGLGVASGVTDRFSAGAVQNQFVSDNAILQVGNELGVVPMVLFVALLVMVFKRLYARARTGDDVSNVALLGMTGILIAGMFHHVFIGYHALVFWLAAGLALNPYRLTQAGDPDDRYVHDDAA